MAQSGRGFFERLVRSIALPEEGDVHEFLQQSAAFAKLTEIAASAQPSSFTNGQPDKPQEQRMVDDINKATTYAGILEATSRVGRIPSIARPLFSLGSYVNRELEFGYWAIQFRDAAIARMASKGYTCQPSAPSYN